jgi:hypothetical protein
MLVWKNYRCGLRLYTQHHFSVDLQANEPAQPPAVAPQLDYDEPETSL